VLCERTNCVKEVKEVKEAMEAKEVKEVKEAMEAKEAKEVMEAREARDLLYRYQLASSTLTREIEIENECFLEANENPIKQSLFYRIVCI
jgi:beta-xylosidase